VAAAAAVWLALIAFLVIAYGPVYAYRTLVWMDSDVGDAERFARIEFPASATPKPFPEAPDPGLAARLAEVAGPLDAFLERNDTTAFLVVRDGKLAYERYFHGARRETPATSFSVAKSFTATLVGIAIAEGRIGSVNDPVTRYLPELKGRGLERVTLRQLLSMSSGIAYRRPKLLGVDAPWNDDSTTYYHPDLRAWALRVRAAEPPGNFLYNNYHPLLLGLVLERTTGRSPAVYLGEKLWQPLGAEYPASWSVDSEAHRFAKMESGINARPIDFAKLGVLLLNGGASHGRQVVPAKWVADAASPQAGPAQGYSAHFGDGGYYGYFWWGYHLPGGQRDFAAVGKHGQIIYVAPRKNAVLVRNGFSRGEVGWWPRLMRDFADRL
jgi:CubicO group peptidase (beta-lactamase class C family)